MACVHLRQLYKLCHEHDLRFSGSDLLHIVCTQCRREEVCPAVLMDEYDAKHPESDEIRESKPRDDIEPQTVNTSKKS